MDWWQAVDLYCERTGPAFWAEPANAVSNIAFIAAALWAAVTARARGITAPVVWLLIAMAGVIGIGSFLFHSFATLWASLTDTLPIWGFVTVFVLTAMRFIGGMAPLRIAVVGSFVIMAALFILIFLANDPSPATAPDPLNGSGQYAPALIALIVFGLLAARKRHPASPWIWAATATFLISLTFRTLDRDICSSFPQGTHFLWHLLNGLMIGMLLQMLIRTGGFAPKASKA